MDARLFCNGNPDDIKYPNPMDTSLGHACFWLERYASPEFFDPKTWGELRYGLADDGSGKTIDILGPLPSRGDYIGVGPLVKDDAEGDPYEMLPLSQGLLDELKRQLDNGAQSSTVFGKLEAGRRVRSAHSRKQVKANELSQKRLQDLRAYIRTNEDRINREHTRTYVGLLSSLPSAAHERAGALGSARYRDTAGLHTLWTGADGSANARIDTTIETI